MTTAVGTATFMGRAGVPGRWAGGSEMQTWNTRGGDRSLTFSISSTLMKFFGANPQ